MSYLLPPSLHYQISSDRNVGHISRRRHGRNCFSCPPPRMSIRALFFHYSGAKLAKSALLGKALWPASFSHVGRSLRRLAT